VRYLSRRRRQYEKWDNTVKTAGERVYVEEKASGGHYCNGYGEIKPRKPRTESESVASMVGGGKPNLTGVMPSFASLVL
jgi:hypothetical protein